MEIKTIQEMGRLGGLATAKKHKKMKVLWGKKGAKIRWKRAKKLSPEEDLQR